MRFGFSVGRRSINDNSAGQQHHHESRLKKLKLRRGLLATVFFFFFSILSPRWPLDNRCQQKENYWKIDTTKQWRASNEFCAQNDEEANLLCIFIWENK